MPAYQLPELFIDHSFSKFGGLVFRYPQQEMTGKHRWFGDLVGRIGNSAFQDVSQVIKDL
jgi:hypothetical protein